MLRIGISKARGASWDENNPIEMARRLCREMWQTEGPARAKLDHITGCFAAMQSLDRQQADALFQRTLGPLAQDEAEALCMLVMGLLMNEASYLMKEGVIPESNEKCRCVVIQLEDLVRGVKKLEWKAPSRVK